MRSFLDAVGAQEPAPGAGAAAAVTAGLAAALVHMAARFSADPGVAERSNALREAVLPLAEADAQAYRSVMGRTGATRREALSRAADPPLAIAEAAEEIRALASGLLMEGNPNLRGEALAAVELAGAARRTAAALVLINLAGMEDDPRVGRARRLER